MVSSGEARVSERLYSAIPRLVFSGMAVVGTFLISQLSFWCVLPGILLSYIALIGMTCCNRGSA